MSSDFEVGETNEIRAQVAVLRSKIDKDHGKNTLMFLSERPELDVKITPTGSFGLDLALGGGIPVGRIVEIYGPESSGKTTMALHMVAQMQKEGICAYVDAEHALDPVYARRIGVDTDDLLISQPDSGEQALSIVDSIVCSNVVKMVVIDSVAALVPKAELEGNMGDAHMGLQARLMSQALRKITASAAKTGCTVIFINQIRMKIGVMFGNPETTTGGNALKFYASVRLDIRRIATLKDKDEVIGSQTRVKVVKNKIAPPFREAIFDILYDRGVSRTGEIVDLALKFDIISKAGSWYSYCEQKIGQGRDNVKIYLEENKELMDEIIKKLMKAIA